MRPFTEVLPKPLVPFLNTPIIAYAIDHLYRAGARRIGINISHLGHLIPPVVEGLVRMYPEEIEIVWVEEDAPRGTAGGLAGIWRALGAPHATLIVLNGDSVMDVDLAGQLRGHQASREWVTMLARPASGDHPGGVECDTEGRVVRLRDLRVGEGDRELDFMGVHFIEPSAMKAVTENGDAPGTPCMVGDVYMPMMAKGRLPRASIIDRFWVALDNPTLLLHATRRCLRNPTCFPQSPAISPITVANPGSVHGGTLLAPPVFIGAFARTHAGARVGPVVCVDTTEIAAGAVVADSVLSGMGMIEGEWAGCVAIGSHIVQVELPTTE
jgi:mannose-1-phosphate guanylyltransferase